VEAAAAKSVLGQGDVAADADCRKIAAAAQSLRSVARWSTRRHDALLPITPT